MKKAIVLFCSLIFSLTSCNLEEKFENSFNNKVTAIRQDVTEKIIIKAVDLVQDGAILEEFNIDTTEIIERINNTTGGSINLDDISLEDLEIKLIEGSKQTNFDFVDALSLTLSSVNSVDPLTIDFSDIEKGLTSLTLPEGVDTSILELIEKSDPNELTIIMNLVTNTTIENDLKLELISTLLAQLGIEI